MLAASALEVVVAARAPWHGMLAVGCCLLATWVAVGSGRRRQGLDTATVEQLCRCDEFSCKCTGHSRDRITGSAPLLARAWTPDCCYLQTSVQWSCGLPHGVKYVLAPARAHAFLSWPTALEGGTLLPTLERMLASRLVRCTIGVRFGGRGARHVTLGTCLPKGLPWSMQGLPCRRHGFQNANVDVAALAFVLRHVFMTAP